MINRQKVVSESEWHKARLGLLKQEKEFTRARDEMTKKIRELPWVQIDDQYIFETHNGKESLADLFDGRSQLVIYHFMMGPDWTEGCKSCSFWADNFNEVICHLNQRDVTMLAVSRAPLKKLDDFKKRMNWDFKWVSSQNSDFNFDFQVSSKEGEPAQYNFKEMPAGPSKEFPGISVFYKDKDNIVYHTYSSYGRGLDMFNTAYHYLDIVPKGRDESDLSYGMEWVKLHDTY